MTFVWIDPRSQRHELTHYQPIMDEVEATRREIDTLVGLADGDDPMMRSTAREAIRTADARLRRLRGDLARWNSYEEEQNRHAAMGLLASIDGLPGSIADVTLVVALHDEHDGLIERTAGDLDGRRAALAAPMTMAQRSVIIASGSRTPPKDTATRAEAKAWLDVHPRFARSEGTDGGWFGWTDRNDHAHRISDPLPIEREMVALATNLINARAALTNVTEPDMLYEAVTAANASIERLAVLKHDLEQFDQAEKAREDSAWSRYAADWRSKRTKA
jgi:hypothetical protein